MTTATVPTALTKASQVAGLDPDSASPLREHATGVWLLPDAEAVARIGRADTLERTSVSLKVANWLASEDFPAPRPLFPEPVCVEGVVVTFWRYYAQPAEGTPPPPASLGKLLNWLHDLGLPPVELSPYKPLAELMALLRDENTAAALVEPDREWLTERAEALIYAYDHGESVLGVGLVHGDAYPGNLLWGPNETVLLGDWDEVAIAPRELDLANTFQGVRFGRSQEDLAQFSGAYGFDVRQSPLFPTLKGMRELHTLASFIRRSAKGDAGAELELRHRVGTLRSGDLDARWHAA